MIQNFRLLSTCVGSGMASIKPEMVVSFANSISDPENKYVINSSPNALMSFKTNRKMPFPDRYKTIIRKMTTSLNVVFLMVRIHFRRNFIVNIPIMKRKNCLKRLKIRWLKYTVPTQFCFTQFCYISQFCFTILKPWKRNKIETTGFFFNF